MSMALIWLVTIGLVWGVTNALMKQGAVHANKREKNKHRLGNDYEQGGGWISWFYNECVREWVAVLCVWQYSLPFVINLSASALFFVKLGESPISVAVPVTNAVTFGTTAAAGAVLGERMRTLPTVLGIALIIAGVSICCSLPVAP